MVTSGSAPDLFVLLTGSNQFGARLARGDLSAGAELAAVELAMRVLVARG
jgi:hypothetical protein